MSGSRVFEPVPGPSGEGTVMLEVGGDRGALIVWAPPALAGAEVELRRNDRSWQGEHTAVRPRPVRAGTSFAAVFGSLAAGSYELRVRGTGTDPVLTAAVAGGSVTEATWP